MENPMNTKARYNRSIAHGMLDNYLSAIDDLTACITIDSTFAMGYYSRAYWYEFSGNYEEAKKDYEQSIKLDPKNYDAYFGLAYIYQNEKEKEKACETIRQAISAGSQIAEELSENFCR
jgi:Tfp pilus assembly protein PilF